MMPSIFVCLKKFNLTANGKIDIEHLLSIPFSIQNNVNIDLSSNNVMKKVSQIWDKVLLSNIHDYEINFFDAGGNSLGIIKLRKEINEAFKLNLDIVDFFEFSSIKQLTNYIENKVNNNTHDVLEDREIKTIPNKLKERKKILSK